MHNQRLSISTLLLVCMILHIKTHAVPSNSQNSIPTNQVTTSNSINASNVQNGAKNSFGYKDKTPRETHIVNQWKTLQLQSFASANAGNFKQSLAEAKQSLMIANKNFTANNSNTSTTLAHIGKVYFELDNMKLAKHYYQQSLKIEKVIADKNNTQHPELGRAKLGLGMVYNQEKNGADALPLIKSAYTILNNKFFTKNTQGKAHLLFELAKSYYLTGDLQRAKNFHERSLAIRKKILGDKHIEVAYSLNELAMIFYKQKQYLQAQSALEESLAITRQNYGNNHPETYVLIRNMLRLFEKTGDVAKQKAICKELHTISNANPDFLKPDCPITH